LNALTQPRFPDYEPPAPGGGRRPKAARWKTIAVWVAGGFAALLVVVVLGVVALLHSERFHAYLLRTAQQKTSEAFGSQVQMKDFATHWSGISPMVDLYGVVVHGAAPYPDPPLLQADALHLGVTVNSLLHKVWYVNDVRIEHPVVRIFADSNGHTNLPPSKQQQPGPQSRTSVFDLGIRHFLLEGGEVYYNDRKSELNADLHELTFRSGFALLASSYSGTLSYRDGYLQLQNMNPLQHNLDARFVATPEAFNLESAVLTTSSSRVSLVARVQDYSQPQIHATYEGVIDAGEFRRALKQDSLPEGIIQLSGSLDYASSSDKPLLATVIASGDLRSTGLTIRHENTRLQVRNIGAHYSVSNGNAEVKDIHAQLLGGGLRGTLVTKDLAGSMRSHLSASLQGISVEELQKELQTTVRSSVTSQILVRGSMNVTADATLDKTMQNLLARADATVQANAQPALGGTVTPINGAIHARYSGRSGQLSFDQSDLRTPQSSISLNGTIGDNASLQVRFNSNDLHELETIATAFRAPGSAPVGVYGHANLSATVTGSTGSPRIAGQLTGDGLKVRGSAWRSLRANVSASPSEIRIENGELDSATQGRVTFNGRTALQQWSFTNSSEFNLQAKASQINVADLLKASGSPLLATGTLSADITASGTQLAPKGHGTIGLASARIGDEPIRAVDLQFQATDSDVNANLKIDLPAGAANATLRYEPATQAYQAELHAPGVKLDQLETLKARKLEIQGVLEVNATGQGTLQDPQMRATIEVPQLQVRDQVIRGLKLQSDVANHVANFTLDSDVLNTHAGGHGTVQLGGDYLADISLDTQSIPLAPLVALYVPSQAGEVTGQTELHATLRGPLKDKSRLEAHLRIPQLAVNYKDSIQLAATAPIQADLAKGVLNVQPSTIRGTGTEVTFQANVPVAKDDPASIMVRGSVDLRLAQLMSPDITSAGQLQFDIDSSGRRSDQNTEGQIRIVNASFAVAGAPLGLQNGNGILTLTRDRLNVTQFKGNVGGGTVTATGGIVYRPQLQFDLAMAAQGVRLLYEQSVRTTFGSNLSLTGTANNALLAGRLSVEQLSFTSDFDISDFMSQFSGDDSAPPTQGFSQDLNLDVGIETPQGLNLVSRALSLAGSSNLHLRGTAAQPVVLGRLNLSGGDLIFSGNRYKLQGGSIDFANTTRTQPVVDLSVNTTISQYDIQMHFWGPADHLHTNYASDPALPPSDIINLIAFGKTSEADAANPTPPGDLGAQSLIASQVSSQVTNRVEKLAGISQLSIDPLLGNSQQNPGARVAIQQRVTSKMFVTFSTDVTATDRQIVKFEYQINRRTAVNTVRDQNGGFSFETTFRKQW
jgi:translocation and assembly module TamB